MTMPQKSAEELRWEARDDARTLARAEEIKADKDRHARAIAGAREIAKEEVERAKGIMKVAGEKLPKTPTVVEKVGVNVPTFERTTRRGCNPATLGRL